MKNTKTAVITIFALILALLCPLFVFADETQTVSVGVISSYDYSKDSKTTNTIFEAKFEYIIDKKLTFGELRKLVADEFGGSPEDYGIMTGFGTADGRYNKYKPKDTEKVYDVEKRYNFDDGIVFSLNVGEGPEFDTERYFKLMVSFYGDGCFTHNKTTSPLESDQNVTGEMFYREVVKIEKDADMTFGDLAKWVASEYKVEEKTVAVRDGEYHRLPSDGNVSEYLSASGVSDMIPTIIADVSAENAKETVPVSTTPDETTPESTTAEETTDEITTAENTTAEDTMPGSTTAENTAPDTENGGNAVRAVVPLWQYVIIIVIIAALAAVVIKTNKKKKK